MTLLPMMVHMELVGIPLRTDLLDEALVKFKAARAAIQEQILPVMQAAGFDPFLDYSPVSKTYRQPPKKPS